ncbi:MAG TPA: GtrA family protein [Bacteroidales bacterium]|jgi:putative flippase GtrA|nr:GtrA family protein [Bacteroidales bacterium]
MVSFFNRALLLKFLKFGIVGFSGVFVDFGFTWLFKEIVKVQKYVANAIGFTVAATSNYFLNRYWTFHSHNPQVFTEYSKFLFISVLGLGISTFVIWIFNGRLKWNFYVAKLFAIGIVTVWNFFANLFFTFGA